MTPNPDPLPAVLDQLAACRDQHAALDTRETAHHAALAGRLDQLAGMITTISRTLAEDTAALARLDAIDRQVTELTRRLTPADSAGDASRTHPAPPWWRLAGDERRTPLTELREWVDRVYRPGYGHLAAPLGPCWPEHDLCLYGLDIASQLWRALYLQPERSTSVLSAQAEYQARILPALAAQLAAETSRCDRHPAAGYRRSTR